MSPEHLKVKCLDRSVCTGSTHSKSKKTWWAWSKLQYTEWTTYCKYMCFGGWFVAIEACLGCNDIIHNDSQLVNVGLIHNQETHPGRDWWSQLWMIFNYRAGKPRHRKRLLRQESRAVSQLPTLWDVDQRCARPSMICQQKLPLCHE